MSWCPHFIWWCQCLRLLRKSWRGLRFWNVSSNVLGCLSLGTEDDERGRLFLDEVVDMPVIVHIVFFVLKTVEVPQLQFLDKVVDVPVLQFIDKVWTSP